MNRCVALDIAAFRKPNMAMAPPTILKIPKSEAPSEFKMSRVVYNDINIVIPIFAYRNPVFFITLFTVDILSCFFTKHYITKKWNLIYDPSKCIANKCL